MLDTGSEVETAESDISPRPLESPECQAYWTSDRDFGNIGVILS